ncbi:MAG: hypothetical protein ACE5FH_05070 [Candidatus Zixiibacteriota bacterium]
MVKSMIKALVIVAIAAVGVMVASAVQNGSNGDIAPTVYHIPG